MGGNTYNRKNISDTDLIPLVETAITNPLKSIFSDREFETTKQWRANVARYLDADSSNRFYFLLETTINKSYCAYCNTELTIHEYNFIRGFSKFCLDCKSNGIYHTSAYLGKDKLQERGKLISKKKLIFYKTDKGRETAKVIGAKNSIAMTAYHKTEQGIISKELTKIKQSNIMKEKILSGKFTPNSNNRNTHWNSFFNNKPYRSSWEALYQYFNPADEHESLRITYRYNNTEYVYIVDFINYDTKIATEVKPKELCNTEKFIAKFNALSNWGLINGFTIRIADLDFLKSQGIPDNLELFDQSTQRKIRKLYNI